jgi:hypothetical protein
MYIVMRRILIGCGAAVVVFHEYVCRMCVGGIIVIEIMTVKMDEYRCNECSNISTGLLA